MRVSKVMALRPFNEAIMMAFADVLSEPVVAVKLAVVAPAGTVTGPGIVR
jgi:hypothetical protein